MSETPLPPYASVPVKLPVPLRAHNHPREQRRRGGDEMPVGLPVETFDQLFATNVRGPYYAILGAAEELCAGGSIVNISSVTARVSDPELAAYAAGKAALESLTRSFASTLDPRGIRVNAVAPGYTDSPLNTQRMADPDRTAAVVDRTPLRLWGLPEDVADAVCFLVSNHAAFTSGDVLRVDGGFPLGP